MGGNIGNPILDLKKIKNRYVTSSFQLSHSNLFVQITHFLNVTNDHLDWHGNMNNYLNSKLKIFQLQSKKHKLSIKISKNLKKDI